MKVNSFTKKISAVHQTFYACLISILLSLAAGTVRGQGSAGLIAHWPMSGNALDVSANGLHGTMIGPVPDAGRSGAPGSALRFNGTAFIDVPYSPRLNTDSLTICATVKQTAFNPDVCQVNQILMRGTYRNKGSYGLLSSDHAFDQDCTTADTAANVFGGTLSTNVNPVTDTMWRYAPAIQANKWYSVVMTYDGSEAKVYVDGAHMSTVIINVPMDTSNEGMYIGLNYFGDTSAYAFPFTGVIDDIALYSRVLDSNEVKAYHQSTSLDVPGIAKGGKGLLLAPNPVNDVLHLQLDGHLAGSRIAVYNSLGQLMLRESLERSAKEIDVSGWPAGHYVMQWTDAAGMQQHEGFLVQ